MYTEYSTLGHEEAVSGMFAPNGYLFHSFLPAYYFWLHLFILCTLSQKHNYSVKQELPVFFYMMPPTWHTIWPNHYSILKLPCLNPHTWVYTQTSIRNHSSGTIWLISLYQNTYISSSKKKPHTHTLIN